MMRIGVALGSGTSVEHEQIATIVEARAPLQPPGPLADLLEPKGPRLGARGELKH